MIAPDIESYLVFHQRYRKDGRLSLRKPVRLMLENGKEIFVSGYTGDKTVAVTANGSTRGSSFSVFDCDDGDLDVLVGHGGPAVRLFENIGIYGKPLFRYTGRPSFLTEHPGGHYRIVEPCDFDGDGRFEVITGTDFGSVLYFRRRPKHK